MKERPILFSAPMVRAILEGRKTQTRRVAKEAEHGKSRACPYGAPGDRLWVRETHYIVGEHRQVFYAADDANNYDDGLTWSGPWKPSIHMPRWASRIDLEVTGVRVERLHAITEEDAKAEGVNRLEWSWDDGESPTNDRDGFECVWVAINGRDSWDANPWVWVVEFKRVMP